MSDTPKTFDQWWKDEGRDQLGASEKRAAWLGWDSHRMVSERELVEARNEIARLSLFADACEAAERSTRSDVTKADRLECELAVVRAERDHLSNQLQRIGDHAVANWDDKVAGEVDALNLNKVTYIEWLRTWEAQLTAARADAERLNRALYLTKVELETISAGESCDHNVGVCWCDTFRAIEIANEALAAHREGVK